MAEEDARAGLVAVLDDWATAIVSNDAERIGEFMADDWVIVSASGISTREQFLSFVSSGELTHSAFERVSEGHVRFHGDVGILTVRVTNTAHYGGKRYDADEWTSDVFVRRADRWLCVLSHITAADPG